MKFRPKIDNVYILQIILSVSIFSTLAIVESNAYLFLIALPFFALNYHSIKKTFFEITDNYLIIHKLLSNTKIDISQITEIVEYKSLIAVNSALSYRKLLIKYGKYGKLYISPNNESIFLENVLKVNPKIKINI